ncbi:CHAT domain-containing protein [Streptomyces venezuelae]|uniref:CHAT domain-containing protein n=1 Tax=Streptomyces venezuelae TaxID=54571 RepID=UPI0037D54493
MQREPDITLRLSWQDGRVTVVVLVNGLPAHEAPRARSVGTGVLVAPGRETPAGKAELLGKLLFPKQVRPHVAERAAALGPGRYLRLRLLLPGPGETGPYDLGSLRWESVRLPSPLATADAWARWADSLALPPDGGVALGRHPWFALVRDVVPDRPAPPPATGTGIVAVADATSVHGGITTPAGPETVLEPEPGAPGDDDRRRVADAVRDSRLSALLVDAPATAEGIRRTLLGGARVFYFGGHHIAGGLVVAGDGGDAVTGAGGAGAGSPGTDGEPAGSLGADGADAGAVGVPGAVGAGAGVPGTGVPGAVDTGMPGTGMPGIGMPGPGPGTAGTGARWLSVDVLAGWLRDAGVGLAVLMACDSATSWADPAKVPSADHVERLGRGTSAAEELVRSGVPHVVAVQGKVSHRQAADFAGRFFAGLVRGLGVDLALREGAAALEGAVAVPVLYARHDSADLSVGELLPALRPARLAPVAHRLSVVAGPAQPPPHERHRVQLDVRWCLAERPVRDVLADPGADDLVTVLTEAERVLLGARAARGLPHEERRRWYVCEVRDGRLPATEAALRDAVAPAYERLSGGAHRGAGLVLRWPVGHRPGAGLAGELDRLHGFGWDLRAVVLQVYGGGEGEVRATAAGLARALGNAEFLLRARTPDVEGAGPPRRERPELPLPPGPSVVAERRGARELLGRAHAVVDPDRPGPVPDIDVRAVVEELNSGPGWGTPAAERQVLGAVRLWWPTLYGALLEAHAAGRTGPGRSAALRLAAERDEDLYRWLRAADGRVPDPSGFSPLDRPTAFVDAVVLGLVRTGQRDGEAFEDWLAEASEAVVRAVRLLDEGFPGDEGPEEEPAEVAVALDRAGALAAVRLPELDPGGRWPGSWALLARRQLTPEIAGWLYGWDEEQRRALGIAPGAGRFDLLLEDQLHVFRTALAPPLRSEGTDV